MSCCRKLAVAGLVTQPAAAVLLQSDSNRNGMREPFLESSLELTPEKPTNYSMDRSTQQTENVNIPKEMQNLKKSRITKVENGKDSSGKKFTVGFNVPETTFGKFMEAVETGNELEVQRYLAKPAIHGSINEEDNQKKTALFVACEFGHDNVAGILLNFPGIRINKRVNGMTPLYVASEKGHAAVVRLLLANPRIDVSSLVREPDRDQSLNKIYGRKQIPGNANRVSTPFYIAVEKGHADVIEEFLKLESYNSSRELVSAAARGDVAMVEKFLDFPQTDVNWSDKNGLTALHEATRAGHLPVVQRLLLQVDIEVNKRSNSNETPLFKAYIIGNTDIMKALIASGGQYNATQTCCSPNPSWEEPCCGTTLNDKFLFFIS